MKTSTSDSFTHLSTDYYRGTVMEPESISKLRASFGEYEKLGEQHREVSSRIQALQEGMKMSRQRGAFQALQNQMKEVKELVKKKEDLDAKMAVADLARKKDDDHRIAVQQEVSYSEQLDSIADRISQLTGLVSDYSESLDGEFDFARCQRPDGSFYGTRGKCKKGTDAGAAPPAAPKAGGGAGAKGSTSGTKSPKAQMKELEALWGEKEKPLKGMKKQLKAAEKAFGAMARETRQNPTPENRQKLKLAEKAIIAKDREVERIERQIDKIQKAYFKARKRHERSQMSPAQLASERALEREMRLRG